MAFYIAKSDHKKAREIARRALEKINFREESERLNVFLAWFNMENACKNEEEAENVSPIFSGRFRNIHFGQFFN
jgi:rRNA biogenesis protein RRP5